MPAHTPLALLIGRRLRAAREAMGLSQVALGALLGMDEKNASPRLSRYERGDRQPNPETLEALSEALGVPPAYFLATSDPLACCILLIAQQPIEKQEKLLELIRTHLSESQP